MPTEGDDELGGAAGREDHVLAQLAPSWLDDQDHAPIPRFITGFIAFFLFILIMEFLVSTSMSSFMPFLVLICWGRTVRGTNSTGGESSGDETPGDETSRGRNVRVDMSGDELSGDETP